MMRVGLFRIIGRGVSGIEQLERVLAFSVNVKIKGMSAHDDRSGYRGPMSKKTMASLACNPDVRTSSALSSSP